MEFIRNLAMKYWNRKWSYYKDQEVAKDAYIKLCEADHHRKMSELKNREPYDSDLVKAEISRWSSVWGVLFNEKCAISDRKTHCHDRWLKYRFPDL